MQQLVRKLKVVKEQIGIRIDIVDILFAAEPAGTPKINLSLRRAPNGFFAVFYLFFPQNKVFKLIDKGIAFAILLIADGYSYIRGNLIGGMTKPSFE